MKPLSLDLRQRIVQAYEDKEGSQAKLARRFKVSESSVERLIRLKRQTGSLEAKSHAGGFGPRITEGDRERLLADFEQEPDLRQEDIAARLAAEGRSVSQPTVSRALKRLGITFKKNDERG